MKTEPPFYLKQLERTFEQRTKNNPRYSLRAFAKDLGFSAPRLSGVFNRKFGLSVDAASRVCDVLKYDAKTTEFFVTSVQATHHRSEKLRHLAQAKIAGRKRVFQHLDSDQFSIIGDWFHYAIMELIRTESFSLNDARKISQRLGISLIESKNALDRLSRLDLIKETDGRLAPTGSFMVGSSVPNLAIQNLNRQLLKKAELSIQSQKISERDLRTLTVSMAPEQMSQFNKLFDDFQKKVSALAESNPNKTAVYAWTMQFFKLAERTPL